MLVIYCKIFSKYKMIPQSQIYLKVVILVPFLFFKSFYSFKFFILQ